MQFKTLMTAAAFAASQGIPAVGPADMFSPSHSCYQPSKPFQFNSQYEVESFRSDVEAYRDCTSNFVDEQKEAAAAHQKAAQEAIDEWNWFVQYELE